MSTCIELCFIVAFVRWWRTEHVFAEWLLGIMCALATTAYYGHAPTEREASLQRASLSSAFHDASRLPSAARPSSSQDVDICVATLRTHSQGWCHLCDRIAMHHDAVDLAAKYTQ